MQIECRTFTSLLDCYAEMQPILCKDSASECHESLRSNGRAQPILCKNKVKTDNLSRHSFNLVSTAETMSFNG